MTTQAQLDGYIRTVWEQQERADRAFDLHDRATAITCRNDAALAIRLAFSAMRRQKVSREEWYEREYGWIAEQTGMTPEEIEADLTAPDYREEDADD